jgi:hypothetical protein
MSRTTTSDRSTTHTAAQNADATTQITGRKIRRTFPFELPPGLRVTPLEADILSFIYNNPGVPYADWPKEVRILRTLENMCRKRYLRRKQSPTRYFLTREGGGLVTWIARLRELAESEVQGA